MKKLFAFLIAFHLMIMPMKAHAIAGMSQITGIAVAAVGVSLIGGCKLPTPSIIMYAAGAAAYLMGEMNAAKSHSSSTKESEDEAKKLQDSGIKGGELQKQTIELQLKQKEEDLKLAKKRKMWGMAAAAIFLASAAMSVFEVPPIPTFMVPAGCTPNPLSWPLAAGVVGAYSFISGGGLMGAIMGAAVGAVAVQSAVVTAFNVGPTRAIAMGVTAGLVTMSAMDAGKAASKLQKEIADLKKVLAQLKAETDGAGPNTEDTTGGATGGVDFVATGGASSGVTSGTQTGALTALPTGTQLSNSSSKVCLGSNQEIGSNCSNPMTFNAPNLNGLGNGPDLQQVANQAAQFGTSAASGDAGKADVAAASLSSQASRMSDLLKKNRDEANKKLVAAGGKAIDYKKAEEDMLKSMQSAYAKETASKQGQLAAFGLDKMDGLDAAKADKSGQNITGASTEAVAALPTSKGDAAAAVVPELPTDANANAAVDAAKNKNAASATDTLGKDLDQYESAENDISKNSGESLWKQVSNRYLLNFDRIFDRKKPAEKQPAQ